MNYDKEKSILLQKIDLLEMELTESETREKNMKRMHEMMMGAFENATNKDSPLKSKTTKELEICNEKFNISLNEIKDKHECDLNNIKNDNEISTKKLRNKYENKIKILKKINNNEKDVYDNEELSNIKASNQLNINKLKEDQLKELNQQKE